jgi:hypothetical protein
MSRPITSRMLGTLEHAAGVLVLAAPGIFTHAS